MLGFDLRFVIDIIQMSVGRKWECILDLDLRSIVSRIVHDILLVKCKFRLREVIEDRFVQLGIERIKTYLAAIRYI